MAGTVNPASLTQPPLGRKLSLTRVPDRSSFARVCKLNNQIHRCLARFSKSVLTLGLKLLHSGPIVAKENLKFQIPFCKINRFKQCYSKVMTNLRGFASVYGDII